LQLLGVQLLAAPWGQTDLEFSPEEILNRSDPEAPDPEAPDPEAPWSAQASWQIREASDKLAIEFDGKDMSYGRGA